MKFKTISRFILFAFGMFMTVGFINDKIQKKIIRSNDYDLHFYVSLKERNTSKDRMYHWYKAGNVHTSFGDAGGELLHNEFLKYYSGNFLAEKGWLKYGLKIGEWKSWHRNGNIKEKVSYVDGRKSGSYLYYNEEGVMIIKGKYLNGNKDAVWINYETKDTLWHKNNKVFKEHPRVIKKRQDSLAGKQSFIKNLFKKKDSDKSKKDPSFFKKLFSKKNKGRKTKKNG